MLLVDEQQQSHQNPNPNPKHHHYHHHYHHHDSTMMGHEDINYHEGDDCEHDEHAILRKYPYLWATIGVIQTFLTAIMFGWASLVPVLRDEALNAITVNGNNGYTPTDLSQIFTASAVGNYLATLPFGLLLDYYGPKTTGIVGSILYGIGLILCGIDDSSYWLFFIGFGLIGASRPGIQLPTLHLANLFTTKEGSNAAGAGGGALYMSAQAAAFDAGTAVFACFHFLHFQFGWKSSMMFRYYLVVPLFTLLTAIFIWPNETLEKSISPPPPPPPIEEGERDTVIMPSTPPPTIGSPHWSPRERRSLSKSFSSSTSGKRQGATTSTSSTVETTKKKNKQQQRNKSFQSLSQVNAPLSVILTKPAFYSLALWVSIHIFQLNYIVATINDQLVRWYTPEEANTLIQILGGMLPFGFVILPIVAHMLHTNPTIALQTANVIGLLFGFVMTFYPNNYWLLLVVVFPAVSCSRQLVYSTLFHTIGRVFGYNNYGVLLGLTNAIASLFQSIQTPIVNYSEDHNITVTVITVEDVGTIDDDDVIVNDNYNVLSHDYYYGNYTPSNFWLWIVTLPLFYIVMLSDPTRSKMKSKFWIWLCCERGSNDDDDDDCDSDCDNDDDDDDDDCDSDCDNDDNDNDNEARNEETYLLQHQGTTVSTTTTASTSSSSSSSSQPSS